MKERDFIELLETAFPHLRREDDAALYWIDNPQSRHGKVSVISTVSDIYAMGGKPREILFTAGLPEGCTEEEGEEIVDGLKKTTSFYLVHLAGGDTVKSGDRFFFNISIIGTQPYTMPIERSGARAGDRLVLFGECGGSLLGMELLRHVSGIEEMDDLPQNLLKDFPSPDDISRLLPELDTDTNEEKLRLLAGKRGVAARNMLALAKRHLVPETRPVDIELLSGEPMLLNAMIDVSDGLARDIRNLCSASGVGVIIREELLPVPQSFNLFLVDERERWTEYVLSSGEEYVMLASCSDEPPVGTVIGEIVQAGEGLTLVGRDGTRRELPRAGYEHTF